MNNELRKKLAEKDAEIERLRNALLDSLSDVLDAKESMSLLGILHNTFPEMNKAMCQQLAASQAREQQLREMFSRVARPMGVDEHPNDYAAKARFTAIRAIELPQDTSAIEAMISKAGEVMRERVIERTKTMIQLEVTLSCVRNEIRALHGVTLEDLK